MQLNFSRNKNVFIRLKDVAVENETKESIFLSGHFITRIKSGRTLREFVHPEKVFDFELPIKYKERVNKLLGEHHPEPVLFEL